MNNETNLTPDREETSKFWNSIWGTPSNHNGKAEWMNRVSEELESKEKQGDVVIELSDLKKYVKGISNWKAPGPDGIQGFWYKRFDNLHE